MFSFVIKEFWQKLYQLLQMTFQKVHYRKVAYEKLSKNQSKQIRTEEKLKDEKSK